MYISVAVINVNVIFGWSFQWLVIMFMLKHFIFVELAFWHKLVYYKTVFVGVTWFMGDLCQCLKRQVLTLSHVTSKFQCLYFVGT